MQKRSHKKWVRKIGIGILVWIVMSMGISSASAALIPMVEGSCPDQGGAKTYPVQGIGNMCQTDLAELKDCGEGVYVPKEEADKCPTEAGKDVGESQTAQEAISKLVAVIAAVEGALNKLLWPILFLIGGLLENDILFGAGMEDRLYDIWVPIRNIVNIIFVIVLVGLALYSVLGINSENSQYSIKTMLPKLIAGIIAVNFSFIGMKVFLDTISVFTSAIFAIPAQIEGMDNPILKEGSSDQKTQAFCKEVYGISSKKGTKIDNFGGVVRNQALIELARQYNLDTKFSPATIEKVGVQLPNGQGARFAAELERLEGLSLCNATDTTFTLSSHGAEYFEKYRSSNAALAMAINMGEVMFYNEASSSLGSGSYESLAINSIFSLLLYIVYGISFGVLFLVLLARLVVLWLGIALSPIIALSIAVPIAKEKLKMGELTQKFVAHAIAPITIALSMTIGWIMLTAIKSTMTGGGFAGTGSVLIPSLPIPGLETLQGLLVSIATVAVVWVGVFAAANETIAGTFTEAIKSKVQGFGSWIATAPFKYVPWVPVESKDGSTKPVSIAGMQTVARELQSTVENSGNEKARKVFGTAKPNIGLDGISETMSTSDLSETMQNTNLKQALKDDSEATQKKLAVLHGSKTMADLEAMLNTGSPAEKAFAKEMINVINKSKHGDLEDSHVKALQNAAKKHNEWREKQEKENPGSTDQTATGPAATKAANTAILQDAAAASLLDPKMVSDLKKRIDTGAALTPPEKEAFDQLKSIKERLDDASTNEATDGPDTQYQTTTLPKLVEALQNSGKFASKEKATEFAIKEMNKRTKDSTPAKKAERAAHIKKAFDDKWPPETPVTTDTPVDGSTPTT
jgi:hypothetical protein